MKLLVGISSTGLQKKILRYYRNILAIAGPFFNRKTNATEWQKIGRRAPKSIVTGSYIIEVYYC
jgi:hypothetical protein